jgi:hypothetical protein
MPKARRDPPVRLKTFERAKVRRRAGTSAVRASPERGFDADATTLIFGESPAASGARPFASAPGVHAMLRMIGIAHASFAIVLFALPLAAADDLGTSDRLCRGAADADCMDYFVVCGGFLTDCHKESNGRWCAVFTTFPPDITWPDQTSPVCRHETYGEPPVDG